jgi:hypothetical protein
MTRPAPQHPDATPQPHTERPCDREGCTKRAAVHQGMGGLCAEHWLALWGVTGWQQSTRTQWSS